MLGENTRQNRIHKTQNNVVARLENFVATDRSELAACAIGDGPTLMTKQKVGNAAAAGLGWPGLLLWHFKVISSIWIDKLFSRQINEIFHVLENCALFAK